MINTLLFASVTGLAALVEAAPIEARFGGGKRGISFNAGALTKFFNAPTVSWMYNWDSASTGAAPGLNYVPMLHGNDPSHTSHWASDVDAAVKTGATAVFSFNEPDQCGGGGACMQDVGATVAAHKKWVQPLAAKHPKLKIGAPAVTNGAKDPATGTPMGANYLKAFIKGCSGCKIDFVAAHWYDAAENVEYFKSHLKDIHAAGGNRPVWVTEFAPTGGDAEAFLREVLPWMDAQPWIHRYAYQWAAPGVLVNDASSGLSALGKVYVTA